MKSLDLDNFLLTVRLNKAQEQGRNIRHYSQYLLERARTYGDVRTDYVRNGEGRLRKLSIEKGLLREVECVQAQIRALLKCTVGILHPSCRSWRAPMTNSSNSFTDQYYHHSSWTKKVTMKSHCLHSGCWSWTSLSCSIS